MNNKGFTLIEVLVTLVVISLILGITINYFSSTMAINKEEAYEVMKNNIISASQDYINECNSEIIDCDNTDSFYANILKDYGYFDSLNSPIDGKDIGYCLLIKTSKEFGVVNVFVEDFCY